MTTGPREGCGNCGTYCKAVSGTQSRGQACGLPQGRGAYLWTPPAFKRSGRGRGHGDPQRPLGGRPVGKDSPGGPGPSLPGAEGRLGVTTAVKKNKIMAFAARQMDLESVIPGEVSQTEEREPDMWNLKGDDTNELLQQKETPRLRDQRIARGKDGGGDSVGVWDGRALTSMFKMDSRQGPAV